MVKLQQLPLLINSHLGSLIYPRWRKRNIPIDAVLYRRIFFLKIDKATQKPAPAAFDDFHLSCDWDKFSTPIQSRELIGKEYKFNTKTREFKNHNEFFICSLEVAQLLKFNQEVEHNPKQCIIRIKGNPNNKAHSLVFGNKHENLNDKMKVKIRVLLANSSKWEIFDKIEWQTLKKNKQTI